MLDILVMVPVFAMILVVTVLIAAPHFEPGFPLTNQNPDGTLTSNQTPGFVWFYVMVPSCLFVTSVVMLVYETVAVAGYGRTPGMAWLDLRSVRLDGTPLGWAGHLRAPSSSGSPDSWVGLEHSTRCGACGTIAASASPIK
jgi:uncharacterized RDD family membrane protein YckC